MGAGQSNGGRRVERKKGQLPDKELCVASKLGRQQKESHARGMLQSFNQLSG